MIMGYKKERVTTLVKLVVLLMLQNEKCIITYEPN